MPRIASAIVVRTVVAAVALTGALTSCSSGGSDPDAAATPEASEGSAATPASSETPAPSTEVPFGETQSVSWQPTDDLGSELSLTVEAVREGRFADFDGLVAEGITEDNQPYYVDVTIANDGEGELGGLDVPLYLADSSGTLTPPSRFAEPFEPCASGPLPESFGAGQEVETCLVFFAAPGAVAESVTFQPTVESPAVSWSGEIAPPTRTPSRSQKSNGKPKRR